MLRTLQMPAAVIATTNAVWKLILRLHRRTIVVININLTSNDNIIVLCSRNRLEDV